MADTFPSVAADTDQNRPAVARDYLDIADRLDAKAAQLFGLTSMLYGDGLTTFRANSLETQDQVMWLINSLAEEIRDGLCNLGDAKRAEAA